MPEVSMKGPDGRLEGRYHPSTESTAPVALLLHPHPQHGGTMNNKVVYTLFQAFQRQGFAVLRFNSTVARENCRTRPRPWTGCRRGT